MSIKYKDQYIFGGSGNINIPAGGKEGQVLVKKSDSDYDVEWVDSISVISNPNLLDNWYFVGGQFPINQRAEKEYSEKGYTVDRWKISNSSGGKVIINDGYITIDPTTSETQQIDFYQTIESPPTDRIMFSILLENNELYSVSGTLGNINRPALNNFPYGALYSYTATDVTVRAKSAINIVAAKLELGDRQTLAHKEGDTWVLNDPPPNYALELVKCQRYFCVLNKIGGYGISSAATDLYAMFPLPTQMRTNPTVLNPSINGFAINGTLHRVGTNAMTISSVANRYPSVLIRFMVEGTSFPVNYPMFVSDFSAMLDANL